MTSHTLRRGRETCLPQKLTMWGKMKEYIQAKQHRPYWDKTIWKQIKKERRRLRHKARTSKRSRIDDARRQQAFSRASDLRLKPTPAEAKLRQDLIAHNVTHIFQHVMFLSQYAYRIADFYLPDYRTIIELDGSYHDIPEIKAYDQSKDSQTKIRVLRYKNEAVYQPDFLKNLLSLVLKKQEKIEPHVKAGIYPTAKLVKPKPIPHRKPEPFTLQSGYSFSEMKNLGVI